MEAFERVYFPFADGIWSYNCAACGSKCCKGYGFSATQQEFIQLSRRHPRLALFADAAGSNGIVPLNNLSDRCFFLQDDGYCRVQNEDGYAAKPFVCRTFPLNVYRLSESAGTLFVSPNVLCPIKRFEGQPGDYQVRHADLLQEVAQAADAIRATAQGVQAQARPDAPTFERVWSAADIQFETWCRDFVPTAAETLSAVAYHAAALVHWEATQALPAGNFVGSADAQACHDNMLAVVRRSAASLGLEPFDAEAALRQPHLLSLVPMLRVWMIEMLTSLHISDVLGMVPATFANLALFAHEAAHLSQRPLTLTECASIQRRYAGAATLMAFLDDTPWLETIPDTAPPSSPTNVNLASLQIVAGLRAQQQLRLSDWLAQCGAHTPPDIISTLDGLWKMRTWLRFA